MKISKERFLQRGSWLYCAAAMGGSSEDLSRCTPFRIVAGVPLASRRSLICSMTLGRQARDQPVYLDEDDGRPLPIGEVLPQELQRGLDIRRSMLSATASSPSLSMKIHDVEKVHTSCRAAGVIDR
jgi:hypothetical protein